MLPVHSETHRFYRPGVRDGWLLRFHLRYANDSQWSRIPSFEKKMIFVLVHMASKPYVRQPCFRRILPCTVPPPKLNF